MAGASYEKHRVWNGNWSARWDGEKQTLDAVAGAVSVFISLKPEKPLAIDGENGVSQKAEGRGRASYYVSFPSAGRLGDDPVGGAVSHGTARLDGS